HLVLHLGRNTGAIVADADLDAVAKIFGGRGESWLIAVVFTLVLAFSCRVEAIRNHVQQDSRDFLWEKVDLAGSRIERPIQGYVESPLLGSGRGTRGRYELRE